MTAKNDKNVDPRERPGGGKLAPQRHRVRIVVVPRAAGRVRQQTNGHDDSHDLTDAEREAAKEGLKRMRAPADGTSAPGGTSARRAPKSSEPTNMLEALTPTDIVVVGRKAASVRRTRQKLEVSGHDDRNRDTVLRVWTESDTIEYQCDRPFEISGVKKAGWRVYDSPDDPFGGGAPYRAQLRPGAKGRKPLWVWTSGLLPARADNQQYKMTFTIFDKNGKNGVEIDPDVVCGNPPPSP